MGSKPPYKPKHLPGKLRRIREILGATTYEEMLRLLNLPNDRLQRNAIHYYETGKRVPGLDVLLKYSELSGLTINELVDDRIDFVKRLSLTNK